jgi:hypothetical protein
VLKVFREHKVSKVQ